MVLQPDSSFCYFVGLRVPRDIIVACVYDAHRRSPCDRAMFSAHDAKALRGFNGPCTAPFGEPCCGYEVSSGGYVLVAAGTGRALRGLRARRTGDRIQTDPRDATRLAE